MIQMSGHITYSIVIPTRNRHDQLAECLSAVWDLDYPEKNVELIIVDDGSDMPVPPVSSGPVRHVKPLLIRIPHSGAAEARNRGAEAAHGKYLLFIDDDCLPHSHYLRGLDQTIAEHGTAIIGGRTINDLPHNPYSVTSQVILNMAYRFYNPAGRQARMLISGNMAIRRDLFLQSGGFISGFNLAAEDRELCDRWIFQGRQIILNPHICVYHRHRLTLTAFITQHFRYGQGAFQYQKIRKIRNSGKMIHDMRFHLRFVRLLLPELGVLPRGMVLRVVPLILLWQIFYLLGYLFEWIKGRRI